MDNVGLMFLCEMSVLRIRMYIAYICLFGNRNRFWEFLWEKFNVKMV